MNVTAAILMAALVGPGAKGDLKQTAVQAAENRVVDAVYLTSREAKAAVAVVLRESTRASGRDPTETTAAVVAAYRRLGVSKAVPVTERRRLQAQLRTRLSELQGVLHRRVVRAAGSNSGGGVAGQAQQ